LVLLSCFKPDKEYPENPKQSKEQLPKSWRVGKKNKIYL